MVRVREARKAYRNLAGGSALHFAPESVRYSHDLDLFHDLESRVAEAFAADTVLLQGAGYAAETVLSQPGFIRAVVSMDGQSTQIDWAHDSAWRFMPAVRDEVGGYGAAPRPTGVGGRREGSRVQPAVLARAASPKRPR